MTTDPTRTVIVTCHFEASPERVFDAFLHPDTARKWLFATPAGQMIRAEIDSRVAGQFTFTDRRDGQDIEHVGTYLEINRPSRLVFQFAVPKFSDQYTKVSIDIQPAKDGCQLTLTHEGVLPDYADRTQAGWGKLLSALAANVDPNAAYAIITDPNTIQFQRLLPGPIERVWSYLADDENRAKWFSTGHMDPQPGGQMEIAFLHAKASKQSAPIPDKFKTIENGITVHERVVHYDPPHRLTWTWGSGSEHASEVTFELSPKDDKVLLTLTHRRLTDKATMADHAGGWHTHLTVLVEVLNNREPKAFWSIFTDTDGVYPARIQ